MKKNTIKKPSITKLNFKKTFAITLLLALTAGSANAAPLYRQISEEKTQEKPQEKSTKKQAAEPASKPAPKAAETSTILNQSSFFDNKISLTFPAAYKPLPLNEIETRYTDTANRPKHVFALPDDYAVNIALNYTTNQNGDRESIIKFFRDIKNGLRAQYPNDVEFMKNDVDNKSQTAYIEFIMPDRQKEKFYNLMFFAYIGSDFFFMNFSCPKSEIDKYQKTAWSIVNSYKVNK